MSKHKHHRKKPPNSDSRSQKQEASIRQLHVTVAVSPESDANVAREIQMVKAALLYADSVTLCSFAVSSVFATRDPQRMSEQQRDKLLVQISPLVGYSHEQVRTLEQLLKLSENPRTLPPPQRALLKELRDRVSQGWTHISAKADEIYKDTGLDALLSTMESGLVKVQPLPVRLFDILATTVDRSIGRENTEAAARRYFEIVSRAISSSDTHLLLDEQTGELVRAAIREGKLQPTEFQSARTKHVGFSAQVLQSLPTFDYASIDEVVHIREQLHNPLVRFRAAMIEFTSAIQSAVWDTDFPQESELVFRQRVEPTLLDLEEEMKANSFIRQLVTKAKQSRVLIPSGSISASSLVLQLSHLGSFTDLASLVLVGSGASTAGELAHVVLDAENAWRTRKQELEQNHMYFAYRANRLMGK